MISRLGLRISRIFRGAVPDPFVIAILLTLLTAALALLVGFRDEAGITTGAGARRLLDSWGARGGIWDLLRFGMQMCLVLVTGQAVAASPPMRRALRALASVPRSAAQAAAIVALGACLFAVVNWGLGLIVGAILAREVGAAMHARGVRAHYPLLAACGYTGLLVWHGGFSGSAPLTSTTWPIARTILPHPLVDELAATLGGEGISLAATILSPMNLFITGGLLVLIPVMCRLLTPTDPAHIAPIDRFSPLDAPPPPPSPPPSPPPADSPEMRPGRIPEWLERSPVVVWILAAALVGGLWRYAELRGGMATITLDEVNASMLALGLVLHGSARSYLGAVEEGARGCAGIIIQFPLYAGIMAMMKESGLVELLAEAFLRAGNQTTIPILSMFSASIVNLFVPSGGGQWAIQGPVALRAGLDAGIHPAKMLMSVAYGDQLTNMLQPFWALPLLAITGVRARDIVGYTAIIMVGAGAWVCLGLLLF